MKGVRTGESVAALAALALLVVTFLEWYAPVEVAAPPGASAFAPLDGLTAWAAFSVLDLLLALVIALGLALLAVQVVGRGPALPVAVAVVTVPIALAATLLVLYRIANQPGSNDALDVRIGAWLGALACAAVFWGAWKALSDERPRPADPPPPPPERRIAPA